MNAPARPRVKYLAKRRKFRLQDCLAGMISEAEQMWGRPVIRLSDAEEVRQDSNFSDNKSKADDKEVETPKNRTSYAEDMEEEHTPRTPSVEWMSIPPPLEAECEAKHGTTPRVYLVSARIEPEQLQHVHDEDPSSNGVHVSTKAIERDTSGGKGDVRPEASQDAEVQTRDDHIRDKTS